MNKTVIIVVLAVIIAGVGIFAISQRHQVSTPNQVTIPNNINNTTNTSNIGFPSRPLLYILNHTNNTYYGLVVVNGTLPNFTEVCVGQVYSNPQPVHEIYKDGETFIVIAIPESEYPTNTLYFLEPNGTIFDMTVMYSTEKPPQY